MKELKNAEHARDAAINIAAATRNKLNTDNKKSITKIDGVEKYLLSKNEIFHSILALNYHNLCLWRIKKECN